MRRVGAMADAETRHKGAGAIAQALPGYAVPVLATAAGMLIGNEFAIIALSAITAGIFIRTKWAAGGIMASSAAGLALSAALATQDREMSGFAAHAAYWMACAGVLAVAFRVFIEEGAHKAPDTQKQYSSRRTLSQAKARGK